MVLPVSRYDPIADWYAEFTQGWGTEPVALMPDGLAGQRILDQGCGLGVACRYLAGLGARVVGLDLSSGMLVRARRREEDQPLGIDYIHGDAASTTWWDGRAFDGAVQHGPHGHR